MTFVSLLSFIVFAAFVQVDFTSLSIAALPTTPLVVSHLHAGPSAAAPEPPCSALTPLIVGIRGCASYERSLEFHYEMIGNCSQDDIVLIIGTHLLGDASVTSIVLADEDWHPIPIIFTNNEVILIRLPAPTAEDIGRDNFMSLYVFLDGQAIFHTAGNLLLWYEPTANLTAASSGRQHKHRDDMTRIKQLSETV
jgi:hypothetical protein